MSARPAAATGGGVNAGLEAGALNDPLDFSELLKSDFWRFKLHFDDFLNQNPTLLQPAGGMDAIAKAFERRVGPLIHYRTVVEEIRKTQRGLRIVYRAAEQSASAALAAHAAVNAINERVMKA